MLASILITIVFLLYLSVYIVLIVMTTADTPLVILFGILVMLLGIGMVYILYTRIREIRSGEEDDLDNY